MIEAEIPFFDMAILLPKTLEHAVKRGFLYLYDCGLSHFSIG
jgi:hypothetical protein